MKIAELHNDYLTKIIKFNNICSYLRKNEQYLSYLCSPVWTSELKSPLNFLVNKKKQIDLIKTSVNIKLCIEDVGFLNYCDYDEFIKLKPFYCGLTWNNTNCFAGGAYNNGGLTKKGKEIVKIFEKNNILIDCAHLNRKSFNDLSNLSTKPLFCSHTGFNKIVFDCRNLDDSQVYDIVNSNGLVGLYFVGKYISDKNVSIFDIVKNINYFVEKFEIKNLAIGTDFYGTNDLPYNLKRYSQFNILKNNLLKIGYKNYEIDCIFYKNFENFIKNIEKT